MSSTVNLLSHLDNMVKEHGKHGMLTKIGTEFFNKAIDKFIEAWEDENIKEGFNALKSYREVEFGEMNKYAGSLKHAKTYYESRAIVESLSYFVGYFIARRGVLTPEGIFNYIMFRRNREISRMIDRVPSFGSTCIMTNIAELSAYSGNAAVIRNFLEPMYTLVNKQTEKFDASFSLDVNFGDINILKSN